MFLCGRSLGGGRKSPLTASLTLAMKSVSLFFLTITGEIQILPVYVRSLTVRDHDCYLKRLTLTDEIRLADPHMLLLKGWTIWQDSLRLSDSHLTCKVKTISQCLSSHEDVYIFQFQQATIFTATLLFQATINHNNVAYIQLEMIIYKSSVCCFTHMHTDIISYTT